MFHLFQLLSGGICGRYRLMALFSLVSLVHLFHLSTCPLVHLSHLFSNSGSADFGGDSGGDGGGNPLTKTCSQPLARNLGLSYGGAWAKGFGQMLNFNCALILYPVLRYILRKINNCGNQAGSGGGLSAWLPLHRNIDFHKNFQHQVKAISNKFVYGLIKANRGRRQIWLTNTILVVVFHNLTKKRLNIIIWRSNRVIQMQCMLWLFCMLMDKELHNHLKKLRN